MKSPKQRVILTACYAAGCVFPRRSGSSQPLSTANGWSSVWRRARGEKIVTLCFRPGCWTFSAITGKPHGQKSGCSRAGNPGSRSRRMPLRMPAGEPRAIRHYAANHAALSAPRIRGSPAGVRDRFTDYPITARSQQSCYNVKVSAHRHQQGLRHRQSTGRVASDDTTRAGPRARLTARPCPVRGWKWRMCSAASAQLFAIAMARRCPLRGGVP